MTTGQKIAARRKELELSQEALGDKLGVSRQTVYKWENDISLPEIDKLVALSRLFQVPVGWLLGVEEEPEPKSESADFSPEQLRLLEEILARYQKSEPEELTQGQRAQVEDLVRQGRSRRRRWPWVLAVLALAAGGWTLLDRLDQMEQQYSDLANSVGNITYSVNSQISSITGRVEEVLKSQNELTADYGTELVSTDLSANTAAFSLRVVPKTYTPGMSVIFLADDGQETLEFPAQEGENGTFTGELTCSLTDVITLSAVFVTGDTRQTQLLDQYSGLYQSSFPSVDIRFLEDDLLNLPLSPEGTAEIPECEGLVLTGEEAYTAPVVNEAVEQGWVKTMRMGLFRNREVVAWLENIEEPENWDGEGEGRWFHLDPMELSLEEGDEVCFAALCTDQYGRQFITQSIPPFTVEGGELTWTSGETAILTGDPAEWDLTLG